MHAKNLAFLLPLPTCNVLDFIFYIFLLCVSLIVDIEDFSYFCLLTSLLALYVVDLLPLCIFAFTSEIFPLGIFIFLVVVFYQLEKFLSHFL